MINGLKDDDFVKSAKEVLHKTRKQLEVLKILQGTHLVIKKKSKISIVSSSIFCHSYRLLKQVYETCFHNHSDCGQILCRGLLDALVNLLLAIRSEESAEKFIDFSLMADEKALQLAESISSDEGKRSFKEDPKILTIIERAQGLRKKYGYNPTQKLKDWYDNKAWKEKYDEVGLTVFYDFPNHFFSETSHANPHAVLSRAKGSNPDDDYIFQFDGSGQLTRMVAGEGQKTFLIILIIFAFTTDNQKLVGPFAAETRKGLLQHKDYLECFEKNPTLKSWGQQI